jgi:hypothetical protein
MFVLHNADDYVNLAILIIRYQHMNAQLHYLHKYGMTDPTVTCSDQATRTKE